MDGAVFAKSDRTPRVVAGPARCVPLLSGLSHVQSLYSRTIDECTYQVHRTTPRHRARAAVAASAPAGLAAVSCYVRAAFRAARERAVRARAPARRTTVHPLPSAAHGSECAGLADGGA